MYACELVGVFLPPRLVPSQTRVILVVSIYHVDIFAMIRMASMANFFSQKFGSSESSSKKPSKLQPFAAGFHAIDLAASEAYLPKKESSSSSNSKNGSLMALSGNPSAAPRPGPRPGTTIESFRVGDRVLVRDSRHEAWEQGYIEEMDEKKGPYVMVDGYENPYYFNWIKMDPRKGQPDSGSDDDEFSDSSSDGDSGDSDTNSEDGDLLGSASSGSRRSGRSGNSSTCRHRGRNEDGDLGLSVELWAAAIAERDAAAERASEEPKMKNDPRLKAISQSESAILFEELYAKWPDDAGAAASRRDRYALIAKVKAKAASTEGSLVDPPGSKAPAEAENEAVVRVIDGDDETLGYGEVLYAPFVLSVLERVKWHGGLGPDAKVFTDIGCGSAKPVVCAALNHPFEVCRGIELLPETAKLGAAVAHEYTQRVQTQFHFRDARRNTRMEVVQGNALFDRSSTADESSSAAAVAASPCNWAEESDVVFCNATSFSSDMIAQLELLCERLKPGSFVVTTTCRLRSPCTEVLEIGELCENWGQSTLYIHRRLPWGATDERYTLSPEEYVDCMNRESSPSENSDGQ